MKKIMFALASVGASVTAVPSIAATIIYNTKTTFSAAAGPSQVISFDDTAEGASLLGAGLALGGVNFKVSQKGYVENTNAVVARRGDFVDYAINGSKFLAVDLVPDASFSLTFDQPTSFFGFDLNGFANGNRSQIVDVYSGKDLVTSNLFSYPSNGFYVKTFLGVVSDQAITKVVITLKSKERNDLFGLDNLTVSRVAPAVPEPATWMMLVLGFGVIGYAMRRKTVLRYV